MRVRGERQERWVDDRGGERPALPLGYGVPTDHRGCRAKAAAVRASLERDLLPRVALPTPFLTRPEAFPSTLRSAFAA